MDAFHSHGGYTCADCLPACVGLFKAYLRLCCLVILFSSASAKVHESKVLAFTHMNTVLCMQYAWLITAQVAQTIAIKMNQPSHMPDYIWLAQV